jgi:hypothetical protein
MKLTRVLIALLAFGISFGYVEAAVVVYLRVVFRPIRSDVFAGQPHDDLFPPLTLEDLRKAGHGYLRVFGTELGRESATLVMLAAVGLAFARNFRQWLAAFMIAFGVWDVFYYVFLKLLIDWPASLGTWDVLFLLPVPWIGPVISPLLIAAAMILGGVVILWREVCGRPVRARLLDWAAIFGGGLVIVLAFCWDWRRTMAGGMPDSFNWPLFAFGLTIGAAGFLCALARPAIGGDTRV